MSGATIRYAVAEWLSGEGEHKRLRAGGSLIFVQSSMADIEKTQRRLDENGFDSTIIDRTEGPFRDYYHEDEAFTAESRRVPGGFRVIDGTEHETLFVVHAHLRD